MHKDAEIATVTGTGAAGAPVCVSMYASTLGALAHQRIGTIPMKRLTRRAATRLGGLAVAAGVIFPAVTAAASAASAAAPASAVAHAKPGIYGDLSAGSRAAERAAADPLPRRGTPPRAARFHARPDQEGLPAHHERHTALRFRLRDRELREGPAVTAPALTGQALTTALPAIRATPEHARQAGKRVRPLAGAERLERLLRL